MAADEKYVLVPARFYDFRCAGPGTPLLKLLGCGQDARSLRDLHLAMTIYAATNVTQGFVPDYEVGYLALPDTREIAERSTEQLVETGLIERIPGGYFVPAAMEWPPPIQTGTRPPIPDYLRAQVYERDGYRCVFCGSADDLSLDHKTPWGHCGPDSLDNLQTACMPHNVQKGGHA